MIVWLASYPRSGNSLLRAAVHACYGRGSIDRYRIGVGSPRHTGPFALETDRSLEELAASPEVFFVMTHDLPDGSTEPAIYLVRDGRDTLASYAWLSALEQGQDPAHLDSAVFLQEPNPARFGTALDHIMQERRSPFGTWSQNVLAWRARPNTAILKFEDLVRHPEQVVACVAQLGLGLTPKRDARVPSFQELQPYAPWIYRRGVVGSWREEFPRELLGKFWQLHGAAMHACGYERFPVPANDGSRRPKVSVLIPFIDDDIDVRGRPAILRSWTRRQTCAVDDYEVLVVYSGASAERARALQANLRPQDRLLRARAQSRFALYDVAAEAARGDLLFITEDHVVAEPDCLAEVLRHFETSADVGANARSGHINYTDVARLEQRAYEEYEAVWHAPDYWNKVRARGFAIRRAAYFAAGGLPGQYGYFAESVLAARLHADGARVGYMPAARFRHINSPDLQEIKHHIRSFMQGEARYAREETPELWDRYFAAPVWSEAGILTRRHNAFAAAAILGTLLGQRWRLRDLPRLPALGAELFRRLARAVCGPRLLCLRPYLAVLLSRLRFAFWRWQESRRYQAFTDLWRDWSHYYRALFLTAAAEVAPDAPPEHRYEMGTVAWQRLAGFHAVEQFQDKTFRWTGPVAWLRLPVPRGSYTVTIDTGALRGPDCAFLLGLFWNRRRIPPASVRVAASRIEFPVDAAHFVPGPEQRLTVVAAPQRAHGRLLGLPICAIELQSLAMQPRRRPSGCRHEGCARQYH